MTTIVRSSPRALKIKLWKFDADRPLPRPKKPYRFPFLAMAVGESFYLDFAETCYRDVLEAKELASKLSRLHPYYFAVVKYDDKLEFARIA